MNKHKHIWVAVCSLLDAPRKVMWLKAKDRKENWAGDCQHLEKQFFKDEFGQESMRCKTCRLGFLVFSFFDPFKLEHWKCTKCNATRLPLTILKQKGWFTPSYVSRDQLNQARREARGD